MREGRLHWLEQLDAKAQAPDGGWPPSASKARCPQFRKICREHGLNVLADAPEEVHEFDLLCLLFKAIGDGPAEAAKKMAIAVRKRLAEIDRAIAMLEAANNWPRSSTG